MSDDETKKMEVNNNLDLKPLNPIQRRHTISGLGCLDYFKQEN